MVLSGIKVATLAAVLVCWSAIASADWSFTRWGMTPQQIANASKGQVTLFDGPLSGGTTGWPEGAKGSVKLGNFSMDADFYFGSQGLRLIDLRSPSPQVCGEIATALNGKYGNAVKDQHFWITATALAEWRSDATNLDVSLVNQPTGCIVEYQPLVTSVGVGL